MSVDGKEDAYARQWRQLLRHYLIERVVQLGLLPVFALSILADQRLWFGRGSHLEQIEVGMVVAIVTLSAVSAIGRPRCPRCARRFFGVRKWWSRKLSWDVKLSWSPRWSWEQRLASLQCLRCGLPWGADSKGVTAVRRP